VANQSITVYQRQPGAGETWLIAGTATTEANGSYQFTPASFSTTSIFLVRSQGAVGAHTGVRVAPQITLGGPPVGAMLSSDGGDWRLRGQYGVTFSGKVSPVGVGALVVLQREDPLTGERWHPIAVGQVDEDGQYSITHAFGAPGEVSLRVVVHPRSGLNVPAASESLSYEISQRQNPQLTIHASTDPISYGQSLTITGVAAAAASQPVTLLARTRGHGFKAVAQAMTDAGGNYGFTESPLQSTFYRVATAARRSIVMFEGLRYALAAEPHASTVGAGATLTFSGTITPDRVGHLIYLERQSASGMGFQVVDAGTIGPTSTYSIVHTFDHAATELMRIRVPRDAENQGDASEPFTIQTTPAPATALVTEVPSGPPSSEG
jgi:hypothetical protein